MVVIIFFSLRFKKEFFLEYKCDEKGKITFFLAIRKSEHKEFLTVNLLQGFLNFLLATVTVHVHFENTFLHA